MAHSEDRKTMYYMFVAHGARPYILLVEDNLDEESLITRAVRHSRIECQVLVAHTTDEALTILFGSGASEDFAKPHPNVIITDLRVAQLGGAEFISEVRSRQSYPPIPIVVLSGFATEEQIEDIYLRGANSFLEKPTDFEKFMGLVSGMVQYWGHLNTPVDARSAAACLTQPVDA